MIIRNADFSEHKLVLEISKQSKYTRDFSNIMFCGESLYQKGWIRVAVEADENFIGFYCVRHKVRTPSTSLYFIGVDKAHKQQGMGEALLADLIAQSPSKRIELNCMKENEEGLGFYKKHNFEIVEESLKGAGWHLKWEGGI